jgi:hypothetical protein
MEDSSSLSSSPSRVKRQRKSHVVTQATKEVVPHVVPQVDMQTVLKELYYSYRRTGIDVSLPNWVQHGFEASLTYIKMTLNYCNSDGTKKSGDLCTKMATWALPMFEHSVPKFMTESRIIAIEQVRTFEEFWCKYIPVCYVPVIMLPLDTPILTVALNPIDIYENEQLHTEMWETRFEALHDSMRQRNKQQYLDFLNGEIAKVSTTT